MNNTLPCPQCVLQGIALATFDYVDLSEQAVARLSHMTDADAMVDEGAALLVTKSRASTLSYNPNVSARQLLNRTRYVVVVVEGLLRYSTMTYSTLTGHCAPTATSAWFEKSCLPGSFLSLNNISE